MPVNYNSKRAQLHIQTKTVREDSSAVNTLITNETVSQAWRRHNIYTYWPAESQKHYYEYRLIRLIGNIIKQSHQFPKITTAKLKILITKREKIKFSIKETGSNKLQKEYSLAEWVLWSLGHHWKSQNQQLSYQQVRRNSDTVWLLLSPVTRKYCYVLLFSIPYLLW